MLNNFLPWYGSNANLAHDVGELTKHCRLAVVPFAGGMSELQHIRAAHITANDLHSELINLARCVQDEQTRKLIQRRLAWMPCHPEQRKDCIRTLSDNNCPIDRAVAYFFLCWSGRSADAGTSREVSTSVYPSFRPTNGGSGAARLRHAVASLRNWQRIMQRCTFTQLDFRELLGRVQDHAMTGIYCDPPFPDAGDKYAHSFTEKDQIDLRNELICFRKCTVVCRFHDHPLIRELYPSDVWHWYEIDGGRNMNNNATKEVLLLRNHPAGKPRLV